MELAEGLAKEYPGIETACLIATEGSSALQVVDLLLLLYYS